jgi:hypothetical protein
VVRRRIRLPSDPLRVVGIDDWAWRRNHRYASVVCNLERRRIVTLLPDREPATAQAWFAGHPTIAIVARDRGGGYRTTRASVGLHGSPQEVPGAGNTALITKTGTYTVSSTEDNSVAAIDTAAGATLAVGGGTVFVASKGTGAGANAGKKSRER